MKYLKSYKLFEKKVEVEDLNSTIALFIYENVFILYDMSKYDDDFEKAYDGMLGYISLSENDDFFETSSIAAEKGYGPLMYEFAMMYAYENNKYIMCTRDGDIREDAFNVWKRFYLSDNSNITKKTLNIEDDNFNLCIFHGGHPEETVEEKQETIQNILEDPHFIDAEIDINAYNTQMNMKSNNDYSILIERAKNSDLYYKKHKKYPESVIEVIGFEYFDIKYSE